MVIFSVRGEIDKLVRFLQRPGVTDPVVIFEHLNTGAVNIIRAARAEEEAAASKHTARPDETDRPTLGRKISGRLAVSPQSIEAASKIVADGLARRLKEKGRGRWTSSHEALGAIVEEVKELMDAVASNQVTSVSRELVDIGVAATFALACIQADLFDW